MSEIASESQRWYYTDGRPCESVKSAKGEDRAPTLRDARKLNLFPSVTSILGIMAKPGLEQWKLNECIMSALTLPRHEGETDQEFIGRIKTDSKEKARKAAERGKGLHASIEQFIQGKPYQMAHKPHIIAVESLFRDLGLDIAKGRAEHSFASPSGFGGKCDWHSELAVVDFKSRDSLKPDDKYGWVEQQIQLSAYRKGLKLNDARCINIYVGVDDAKVIEREWTPEEIAEGEEMWHCLMRLWQIKNRYCA